MSRATVRRFSFTRPRWRRVPALCQCTVCAEEANLGRPLRDGGCDQPPNRFLSWSASPAGQTHAGIRSWLMRRLSRHARGYWLCAQCVDEHMLPVLQRWADAHGVGGEADS